MKFYLGTHIPGWLRQASVPLFISHRRLREIKALPMANTNWALDSGGFSELSINGSWTISPIDYVSAVRRYQQEIGNLDWAAPQDWMCEPWIVAKTGLTVKKHQHATVHNFLDLRDLAPELPIIPVLQGWELRDYDIHANLYERHGIKLDTYATVGLGSVCRRQATKQIADIVKHLHLKKLNLHGFGVKAVGLRTYGNFLVSSDSMAWSFGARYSRIKLEMCTHKAKNCANCMNYAMMWRNKIIQGSC